jgi:hypothetical protein
MPRNAGEATAGENECCRVRHGGKLPPQSSDPVSFAARADAGRIELDRPDAIAEPSALLVV